MSNEKDKMNIIFIGHVDSGKSTTIGHLMYKCGGIDEGKFSQIEQEAAEANMTSFKYAMVLDNLKAERERGITIDTHYAQLQSDKRNFTVIDAPGHRDFLKNMITGASQADAAVLMISNDDSEFRAGIAVKGQTIQHAIFARNMGVQQLVVCINKMDHGQHRYSERHYDEIKIEITNQLKRIGYRKDYVANIPFIPISGLLGENLIEACSNTPWYTGPTLLEALDALSPPNRPIDKPLRLPISDVYNIGGIGTVAVGCVETGVIRQGMVVSFGPTNVTTEVKSIKLHDDSIEQATPGDIVGFNVENLSPEDIKTGYVASDPANDPATDTEMFVAQVKIVGKVEIQNGYTPKVKKSVKIKGRNGGDEETDPACIDEVEIQNGYTAIVDCHTCHIACEFKKIRSKRNEGGEETDPAFIRQGDEAIVEMVPTMPMVVEEFSKYPPLGSFIVRDMEQTIAIGIIKEVIRK